MYTVEQAINAVKSLTDLQYTTTLTDSINTELDIHLTDKLFQQILERLTKDTKIKECKCVNCGAPLEVEYTKPIVVCRYCNSSYVMGKARVNDMGE